MSTRITLTLEGHFARIRPKGYLGDEWKTFRQAIEGAQYDAKTKTNFATLDKVSGIIRRLREADFPVGVDHALEEALSKLDAQLWLDMQQAQERVQRVDEEIRAGGKSGLFAFQKTGVVWLTQKHGALLADDMGLGKTLQTLAALPQGASVLVVAPAVAKSVWQREARKWRPHLRVSVLSGRGSFRWPDKNEVVVVNYDILPDVHTKDCLAKRKSKAVLVGQHEKSCLKARKNLFVPAVQEVAMRCPGCLKESELAKQCRGCLPFLKDTPKDIVIVADEAHNLKSPNAQRTVRFRGLSFAARSGGGRTWLLTATPLMNRPPELWAVLDAACIAEEVFGSYKSFFALFKGRPVNDFGGVVFGTPDSDEVSERLQRVMLRRTKQDVLTELPAKRVQEVEVQIDERTLKLASAFTKQHGGVEHLMEQLGKTIEFKTLAKLRATLAAAKVPALVEMVEEYEEAETPVVVFSAHRGPVDLLASRPGWASITGDTSAQARGEIQDRFQAGELKGVACTIKAGGVAITLTRAADALFVDLEWSPALNSQAEDRIYRIGQDKPVLIKVLTANHPLDERVNELLMSKRELIAASVEAAKEQQAVVEEDAEREEDD